MGNDYKESLWLLKIAVLCSIEHCLHCLQCYTAVKHRFQYRKLSNGKFQEMDLINDMILSANKSYEITFDKQLVKSVEKFNEFYSIFQSDL